MNVICENLRNLWIALSILAAQSMLLAQTPEPSPTAAADEEMIVPTFETQKLARTYILDVPAPRGQITDRHGAPLAQNKVSYNLAINFPTPLDFSDAQAVSFARVKIDKAQKLIGRTLKISDDAILRHYRNCGVLPSELAQRLPASEHTAATDDLPSDTTLRPAHLPIY